MTKKPSQSTVKNSQSYLDGKRDELAKSQTAAYNEPAFGAGVECGFNYCRDLILEDVEKLSESFKEFLEHCDENHPSVIMLNIALTKWLERYPQQGVFKIGDEMDAYKYPKKEKDE